MNGVNVPYVRQTDENGICTNPIKGTYRNAGPNRAQRRANQPRFKGNKSGFSISVDGRQKFYRVKQIVGIDPETGGLKIIDHYLSQKTPAIKRKLKKRRKKH